MLKIIETKNCRQEKTSFWPARGINDLRPLFALGVETKWYGIFILGNTYSDTFGEQDLVNHKKSCLAFTITRIGIGRYNINMAPLTNPATKAVHRGVIRFSGSDLRLSIAENGFRPLDADPENDRGDEVRCFIKK